MSETKEVQEEKIIDTTDKVKVKCTKDAPFHQEGEITHVAPAVAQKMEKNKWGTIIK